MERVNKTRMIKGNFWVATVLMDSLFNHTVIKIQGVVELAIKKVSKNVKKTYPHLLNIFSLEPCFRHLRKFNPKKIVTPD